MRTEASIGGGWNAAGEPTKKGLQVKVKPCKERATVAGSTTSPTGTTFLFESACAACRGGGKAEAVAASSWWFVVSV